MDYEMYEGFEEFLLADAADNESESANQVIHNQLEVVDATHNENEPLDAMIHNQLQPVDSIVEECTEDELDISGSLIGVQKKTIEELYELYRLHSGALGFSIRKYTSRIGRVEGNVYLTKEKYFVCSCHGKPDGQSDFVSVPDVVVDEDGNERKRKQRRVIVTKTGCNAMMRVKLNDSGMYEVIGHVLVHNHELTRTEWQHYHRSERAIGDGKAKEITVMTEASMRPAVQYRYECDSESGVGESTASNSSTVTVFDPPWVKTKGRSVRPKSGIEKSKRGRGRGKCVSNVAKEFGSYTPPARLF
ncbi:hypothetical protein BVRB_6g143880 [Beta vulgaris subsp. vulgaris]|nr:hypothetical protein BVRB_6g143880 [Beta vulgaris subsp. vulgaris]